MRLSQRFFETSEKKPAVLRGEKPLKTIFPATYAVEAWKRIKYFMYLK